LINLSELYLRTGRQDVAEVRCVGALTIAERRGDRLRRAEALRVLAELWAARGELDRCETALDDAMLLTNGGEDALLAAEIWRAYATLARLRGAPASEREALVKARHLFTEAGAWQQVAAVNTILERFR
jgi:hypothetical protein